MTEFHYHDRDGFFINVEYFSREDLRTQFEEFLHLYRNHRDLSATPQNGNDRADDPHEREDLQRRNELATSTFQAAFPAHFTGDSEVFQSLPISEALDTLMDWVSTILPREAQGQPSGTQDFFDNIGQYSNRLKVLTSENEAPQRNLWPFIRKIRYVTYVLPPHLCETET